MLDKDRDTRTYSQIDLHDHYAENIRPSLLPA